MTTACLLDDYIFVVAGPHMTMHALRRSACGQCSQDSHMRIVGRFLGIQQSRGVGCRWPCLLVLAGAVDGRSAGQRSLQRSHQRLRARVRQQQHARRQHLRPT